MSDERKRIVVYVSEEQHIDLKVFCAKMGISMSNFIDHAIREKIKKEIERRK